MKLEINIDKLANTEQMKQTFFADPYFLINFIPIGTPVATAHIIKGNMAPPV